MNVDWIEESLAGFVDLFGLNYTMVADVDDDSSNVGNGWTDQELRAAVQVYLEMLQLQSKQEKYNKAEFNRRLREGPLQSRSEGSVEYRMQNISAVLAEMNQVWVTGYKPAGNAGTSIKERLRSLLAEATENKKQQVKLADICTSPDLLMGVKAVFSELSSHVLCFGGRGDINKGSYFSVAGSAAKRAVERPYVLTIGGGERVSSNLEGRVLNLARVSCVYGPTSLFVAEPSEVARLAQWPVAVVLHDVWRVEGLPHLVSDLRMPDRKVLAGAQDGVVRPEGKIEPLWDALRDTPLELVPLPLPANFYDPGKPTLSISKRPVLKTGAGSDEGEQVWRLQKLAERDPRVSRDAKLLNAEKFGRLTCEACDFSHSDFGMFDAHHPTPLAIGFRTTLPEHLEILCPTCHRRAHREDRLSPLSVRMLREWNVAGRP